jgi:hypothetical protein
MALCLAAFCMFANGCADSDVTFDPKYGFAKMAGSTWKAKVELAVGEMTTRTYILAPEDFDPSNPKYVGSPPPKVLARLPVGTSLRFERLMKDNVDFQGVRVVGALSDGSFSGKTLYISIHQIPPSQLKK